MNGIDTSDMAGLQEAVMEGIGYGARTIDDIHDRVNAVRDPDSRWVTEGRIVRALRSLIEEGYVWRSALWQKVVFGGVETDTDEDGLPSLLWYSR